MKNTLLPLYFTYLARKWLVAFFSCLALFAGLFLLLGIFVALTEIDVAQGFSPFSPFAVAFLQVPGLLWQSLIFICFAASMYCFYRLRRDKGIVTLRLASVSPMAILAAPALVSVLCAVLASFALEPAASSLRQKAKTLKDRVEGAEVDTSGQKTLWLREPLDNKMLFYRGLYDPKSEQSLLYPILVLLDSHDELFARIDATSVRFRDGRAYFKNASIFAPGEMIPHAQVDFSIPTQISASLLAERPDSARNYSVFALPSLIRTLQKLDLSTLSYRYRWHDTLATPLKMLSMLLIAATITLHLIDMLRPGFTIFFGVMIGYVLYVLYDVALLGVIAGLAPPAFVAWGLPSLLLAVFSALFLFTADAKKARI